MSTQAAPTASLSPKAAHYNASLTAALSRGAWGDDHAGTAPNGTHLSWGELVRKWGKHTGGNVDLIHRLRDISLLHRSSHNIASSGFINVPPPAQAGIPASAAASDASPTAPRAGASNSSQETTTSTAASSFIHVPHPHLRRHKSRLSSETTRPAALGQGARAMSPAPAGGSRAAYLSSTDLDGDDQPDGTAWSVGRGWWVGVGPDGADEAREGVKALESLISGGQLRAGELQSARITLGYHLYALGSHEEALRIFGGVGDADVRSGVVEGDAAVLERIRARCLQGLSAELQQEPEPQSALQAYESIISLVPSFSFFSPILPSYLVTPSSPSPSRIPFESHRELHRYLSTALCRAAIISARTPNANTQTLQILRTYHAYATTWPPSFKPLQRQRMLQLYIRALFAAYPKPNTASTAPYTLDASIQNPTVSARALWQREASEAMKNGRALLSATTAFPRAGSVNAPVTQFCNLIVALADRCSALQPEVIETLWWAMTLTFQSQAILRHLTRLQTSQGQIVAARKTFELYVQLVLKARETQQPEISLQLKRRPTDDHPAGPEQIAQEAEEAQEDQGPRERLLQVAETEIDNDEQFIEALLVGSRLLLKDLGEIEEAWRYASLAGEVVENAQSSSRKLHPALRAEVEALRGIVRMTMGTKEADPIVRPKYQAQAIDHLVTATRLDKKSASVYYHLAFCQAEARSTEQALVSIRRSLELDARNVQAWHLLALILTARNDWQGAAKAGEAGVSVWEQEEARAIFDEEAALVNDPAVTSKDFATGQEETRSEGNEPLLLPSGSFHPPHLDTRPPPSALTRAKRLEQVIKLRITLNVVAERTLGAEVAMLRQQELFAFFSARSGKNRESGVGIGYSKELAGSVSFSMGNQEKDLGGSYVSVNVDPTPAVPTAAGPPLVPSVQPPTPLDEPGGAADRSLAPPVMGPPVVTTAASPTGSSAASEIDSPDDRDGQLDEKERKERREHKLLSTKRLMAKHLHVSHHGGSGRTSRPSSVRRLHLPEELRGNFHGNRNASASSVAASVAPTAVHSHFRSSNPTPPPPPPAQKQPTTEHTPVERRILSNLWLMSAATFRRWGKPEQCLVAIEEAEVLDPENPDVWVQLGLYHTAAVPPNYTQALPAFTKAILLKPNFPSGLVNLSKLYFNTGETELAHSLLNQMTQGSGWDVPEAWFYLGQVCEKQGRVERSRECWKYALELEETRPARRWEDAVDRC